MATAPAPPLAPHRFRAAEYFRMVEAGILTADHRVELLGGQIVEVSPTNPPHAAALSRSVRVFTLGVGDRALVRDQSPLDLAEYDAPEPDVALVRPRADEYATGHPTAADVLLVLEISDTTLATDRATKLPLYAAAGVREAWLLNLQEDVLEVHREPGPQGYAWRRVYRAGERVAPEALPQLEVAVEALLPPAGLGRERRGSERATDRGRARGWDLER